MPQKKNGWYNRIKSANFFYLLANNFNLLFGQNCTGCIHHWFRLASFFPFQYTINKTLKHRTISLFLYFDVELIAGFNAMWCSPRILFKMAVRLPSQLSLVAFRYQFCKSPDFMDRHSSSLTAAQFQLLGPFIRHTYGIKYISLMRYLSWMQQQSFSWIVLLVKISWENSWISFNIDMFLERLYWICFY